MQLMLPLILLLVISILLGFAGCKWFPELAGNQLRTLHFICPITPTYDPLKDQ